MNGGFCGHTERCTIGGVSETETPEDAVSTGLTLFMAIDRVPYKMAQAK
jgi:hypothetical protein